MSKKIFFISKDKSFKVELEPSDIYINGEKKTIKIENMFKDGGSREFITEDGYSFTYYCGRYAVQRNEPHILITPKKPKRKIEMTEIDEPVENV